MQEIKVQQITNDLGTAAVNEASIILDELDKYNLNFVPWKTYPYKPKVSFAIGYTSTHILLKFFVEEKYERALHTTINSPVWEDSCVEFFIKFNSEEGYYNLEFNSLGTSLAGYGSSKTDRILLDEESVKQIITLSEIKSTNGDSNRWNLTVLIPLGLFKFSKISTLVKQTCTANFYKCGDLMPEPHFISWSNIKSSVPNFHLSQHFGKLEFI